MAGATPWRQSCAQVEGVRDVAAQGLDLRCQSLERITATRGPVKLIMRPRYQLDETNTRETVAVVLHPGGLGEAGGARGAHWHVEEQVTYTTSDVRARKIDLVEIHGHNRIGHGISSPGHPVDEAGTARRARYVAQYPLVPKLDDVQVTRAIDKLKQICRLISTLGMKVQGQITTESIPSECATCHTFPQIGTSISGVLLGAKPADYKDNLYVFNHESNHKSVVSNTEPTGTTCGACHRRSYCENCHKSGAIKVKHTAMLYNHATAITTAGGTQACAYCHQPVSCARCHEDSVLPPGAPLASKARRSP